MEGSLKSQMFGVFAENYRMWQERYMNPDGSMQVDFTKFFGESEILSGREMSVYRALLFFNLPENIVFKPVKPVKVFSATMNA